MRRIAMDYDRLAKLAEEQLADQERGTIDDSAAGQCDCGPWGDGPAYGAREAPTRRYPSADRERLRYLNRVNFLMAASAMNSTTIMPPVRSMSDIFLTSQARKARPCTSRPPD